MTYFGTLFDSFQSATLLLMFKEIAPWAVGITVVMLGWEFISHKLGLHRQVSI